MTPDETPLDESAGPLFEKYHRAVDERDFDSATEAVEDIFAMAMKWCEENPSPELDLTNAAGEFEECGDWRSAESMYKRILSLPDTGPLTEYKAHADLAGLYRLLHRDADALDHARKATAAARRDDVPMVTLMALRNEARCLIGCGLISEAHELVSEAIPIIDDDEMYSQMRASFLTLRAECMLQNASMTEAQSDLEETYRLLEPLAEMGIAGGVHGDLSRWWSVTARLRAAAWRQGTVRFPPGGRPWRLSKHVASLPHSCRRVHQGL